MMANKAVLKPIFQCGCAAGLVWSGALLAQGSGYGILGRTAPELGLAQWTGPNGRSTKPVALSDLRGKVVVMEFWQYGCPGCHSHGLPAMKRMYQAFKNDRNVAFLAVQTVFEAYRINTADKVPLVQRHYGLWFPMAHDAGNARSHHRSIVMRNYRSGGTPWTVIVSPKGKVVFNDFFLDPRKAIPYIRRLVAGSKGAGIPGKGEVRPKTHGGGRRLGRHLS